MYKKKKKKKAAYLGVSWQLRVAILGFPAFLLKVCTPLPDQERERERK